MKYLVQILLPLYDNDGRPFGQDLFTATRGELMGHFGGVTAHMRAPARGLWKIDEGDVARDDIVIVEVMAAAIDAEWWSRYRGTLRRRFAQDELVIRAIPMSSL
ncbi:hypothetical protein BH18ACI5_BH18ACI5_21380 [soil metagenome]